jgi:hypothetical protein
MSDVTFPPHPLFKDLGGETYLLADKNQLKDPLWSLCNPSIGVDDSGLYAVVFRSSNLILDFPQYHLKITTGNLVKNRVYFAELDADLRTFKNFSEISIVNCPFPIKRGIEDFRLFWRDNSWWMLGVVYEVGYMSYPRVGLFKYNKDKKEAKFIHIYRSPKGEKAVEKNWMLPYKENPNFDFIYECGVATKDDIIVVDQKTPEYKFRGGSCLLDLGDSTYLAVVHRNYMAPYSWYQPESFGVLQGVIRNYSHCFVRYNWYGEIIQYTEPFQFISPGVEFAAGMVEHGGQLIISFGKQDASSHIAKISKEKVLSILKDMPNEQR